MHCVHCGKQTGFLKNRCPHCGQEASPYVHLSGVLLGLLGSLIGFTFFEAPGALLGGLIGVSLYGLCFRLKGANR
jgi:hypothetical protein